MYKKSRASKKRHEKLQSDNLGFKIDIAITKYSISRSEIKN
ncbi:hypothetical protein T190611E02C_60042 [Tenacibaculum sp. 190524A05c]